MDKTITGSLEALSALELNKGMEGLDASTKNLLHQKEFLSVILMLAVKEFEGYSAREIMDFIEPSSISIEDTDVSNGRTNAQIEGDAAEFNVLHEKVSYFDILFKAKNPKLSEKNGFLVNLHIDIEPQKDYKPGYPIEKRGLYYLARRLSSQLGIVTETTDYSSLEKCYSIWICRDNIPKEEQATISFFEIKNTNIGNVKVSEEDYDLMTMIVIRLGHSDINEGTELIQFLNSIFFPQEEGAFETISNYIDFSENEELRREVRSMTGIGQSILDEGIGIGVGKGIKEGISLGENRLAKLVQTLLKEKKYEEASLVTEDIEERQRLYKLYGIIDDE